MSEYHEHAELCALVRELLAVEKLRTASVLRIAATERVVGAVPADISETFGAFSDAALASEAGYMKRIRALMRRTVLGDFVAATMGLGPATFVMLGRAPDMRAFANPAKVWRWFGLDVRDGRAPRTERGKQMGFSLFSRAIAIKRVSEPTMKGDGPYRAVYDARRAHTLVSHPDGTEGCATCEMARAASKQSRDNRNLERERTTDGFDCSRFGGPHWSKGHRHADAQRVVAKAIILDLWRVAHSLTPRYGGPTALSSLPSRRMSDTVAVDSISATDAGASDAESPNVQLRLASVAP